MSYTANDIAIWFLLKDNESYKKFNTDEEPYEKITNMKLQKLLYYAQGICLAMHNKPLFYEKIEAWKHGPVIPEVYCKYSAFKGTPLEIGDYNSAKINEIEDNDEIRNILEITFNNFAIYTAWQLRNMTHQENSPWDITLKNNEKIINNDIITDFFKREIIE